MSLGKLSFNICFIHYIILGGYEAELLVQSLDLGRPSEWTLLPALPTSVTYGVFVQDGDDLILLNTEYGNVLRFDEADRTFSVIQSHAFLGDGVAALAVTDGSLSGCK